jgi:hypothetical protein
MSDKNVKFLSYFWKVLWGKLETILLFFYYLSPTDRSQTEMVNTTLTQLLKTIIQKNLKN